jgi:hypothetical protein
LYDGTSIIKITSNDYWDFNPQINESGEVVWYARESLKGEPITTSFGEGLDLGSISGSGCVG